MLPTGPHRMFRSIGDRSTSRRRLVRTVYSTGVCTTRAFVGTRWVGLTLAANTLPVRVLMECTRCVMTTLAQSDLPLDRLTLRTLAAHNRIEIEGMGQWACAGVYADVADTGTVRIGDSLSLVSSPQDIVPAVRPTLNRARRDKEHAVDPQ
jgi:uncharacterized protein YcbX